MAKVLGRDSAYLLKDKEIATDFKTITASTKITEANVTTFGQTAERFLPSFGDGEHTLDGLFEAGAGSSHEVMQDLLDDTAAAVASFCPRGITEGYRACLLEASVNQYSVASNLADAVLAKATLKGAGGCKWGQILRVATITATDADPTGYDNPSDAATTKGAAFHLHVTTNTRDAGSVIVKIQDSADNASWADVTGMAFTSVAAAATTSERITYAKDSSLRRYVRAFATVTAGATGSYVIRVTYQRNM